MYTIEWPVRAEGGSVANRDAEAWNPEMITSARQRKEQGIHYTPPQLARFVSSRIVQHVDVPRDRPLRVLDPACGNGALLDAFAFELRDLTSVPIEVHGIETDPAAASHAEFALRGLNNTEVVVRRSDFLTLSAYESGQRQLWEPEQPNHEYFRAFDVVIANPPYVRTQVLGAAVAQRLASRYNLNGRVDLAFAFWVAAAEALRPGGIMGIITSNKFMTTLAGGSVRRFLVQSFEPQEIIDLGDTKLFQAAVLPAVFVGRRLDSGESKRDAAKCRFTKVYSVRADPDKQTGERPPNAGLLNALRTGAVGQQAFAEGRFEIVRGEVSFPNEPDGRWVLATSDEHAWVRHIRESSAVRIGAIAQVRVGVKTTADEVFIREDWDRMRPDDVPEATLLHPLLRHGDVQRWTCASPCMSDARILYPHIVKHGIRRPIDLECFPRARRYLEQHRQRLEGREYVLSAGRRWYEIWVPQDPAGWSEIKIVFPDISPEPRFALDTLGRIVDGNCYWITLRPGIPEDALYLILGVANSRMMMRFHDLCYNNRLYASRRRFLTQYANDYPMPDLNSPEAARIIEMVKQFINHVQGSESAPGDRDFEIELEDQVLRAFNIDAEARC